MPDENEQPKERKTLDDRAKMTELEPSGIPPHVLATGHPAQLAEAQFARGRRSRTGLLRSSVVRFRQA